MTDKMFKHPFNFPQPLFIMTGPGYVRVLEPDDMAEQLVTRYLWEEHLKNARLYVKTPFDERLVDAWPVYPKINITGDRQSAVLFKSLDSEESPPDNAVMWDEGEPLHLHVDWLTKEELDVDHLEN